MARKTEAEKQAWQNKIVGYGERPASDFLANPMNWRIHPRNQQDALGGVLDSVGWVDTVLVNKQTGNIVDGHLRVTLALRQGDDTPVPYLEVDLTPEQEALILATLDPIAAMAGTDRDKLDETLRLVQSDDERVQELIAGIAADAGIIPPDFLPVDESEQPRLDQKKAVTCPECGAEFTPK